MPHESIVPSASLEYPVKLNCCLVNAVQLLYDVCAAIKPGLKPLAGVRGAAVVCALHRAGTKLIRDFRPPPLPLLSFPFSCAVVVAGWR